MIRTLLATALLAALLATQEDAAPTSHEDPAVTYLTEAETLLYQPEGDGLESLSFTLRRSETAGGGTTKLAWTKGQEPRVEAELGEQVKAAVPEPMHEMMTQQLVTEGQGLMRYVLNRQYTMMLDDWSVKLAGLEDGLMRVALTADPASASAGTTQSYFFDGDQILRKAHFEQSGGAQKIAGDITFTWRPAAEGRDELLLESQEAKMKMPFPTGEIDVTLTTSYSYATIGDVVIMTGMTEASSFPVRTESETRFEDLVVNGKPVGDA